MRNAAQILKSMVMGRDPIGQGFVLKNFSINDLTVGQNGNKQWCLNKKASSRILILRLRSCPVDLHEFARSMLRAKTNLFLNRIILVVFAKLGVLVMSLMALTTIPAIFLPEQRERDMRLGQFLVDFLAVWHCEGRVSLFPVDWKQFVLDVRVCHL